jgi:molybdate transport system substrate-binding protein
MGVAVRAGAAKPDISSIEAFKHALLAAKSIVYSDPTSGGTTGIYFEKVLDRLGIAKEIKAKAILNAPTATPNTEVVARGEAELGIQLISEIVSIPGAELLGPFPGELQRPNVLVAGIATDAPEPDAAKALLKFMAASNSAEVIRKLGMEPGG